MVVRGSETKKTILVTGAPERRTGLPEQTWSERTQTMVDLEWDVVPVLEAEPLPLSAQDLLRLETKPFDGIVFSSQNAITRLNEELGLRRMDLPEESTVFVMGKASAMLVQKVWGRSSFKAHSLGSDSLYGEIKKRLGPGAAILIVRAEDGRPDLERELRKNGYEVSVAELYRTVPYPHALEALVTGGLNRYDCVVLTSPSSLDVYAAVHGLDHGPPVVCLGTFTEKAWKEKSGRACTVLPNGDWSRIGDIL